MYQHKGSLKESGFEIETLIRVRCLKCGKTHIFNKNEIEPDKWSEESHMGMRTEYAFLFEKECNICGSQIRCTVRVSEYPTGTIEGIPSIECYGCEVIGNVPVKVAYHDYEEYFKSDAIPVLIIPKNERNRLVREVALVNGNALINKAEEYLEDSIQKVTIELPTKRVLFDILVDETDTIHFDENRAVLAEIIDAKNPKKTALRLLGKVAEAVVVRRCSEKEETNKRWLDKARRGISRPDIARRFRAIGTGLHSTKRYFPHKYNPFDTQRDIIWMDKDGKVANIIGSTAVSGLTAGLQIKVSGDGVNYVQKAIVKNKYEVPIIYFPVNDDYEIIVQNIEKKMKEGIIKPVKIGSDFINAEDVDKEAFQMVLDYLPILTDLFEGRMSADDFVKEAIGLAPLENAIFANVFEGNAEKILLFK